MAEIIPPQPYVYLHVTWFTTRSQHPRPEYFGLAPDAQVPTTILTTYNGVRAGGVEPEFNSISYHGLVRKVEQGEAGDTITDPEWSVKVFSKERISDDWLESVFGNVGWVYRKLVARCCPRDQPETDDMFSGRHTPCYFLHQSSLQSSLIKVFTT